MEVFFYGLFMDEFLLMKNGVVPSNVHNGQLQDYELRIGARASLAPCVGEKSYGVLMTLLEEDVSQLYAEESVADYLPEQVNVLTETGETIRATCYNLPSKSISGTNVRYACALYELADKLGFPGHYLEKIRAFSEVDQSNKAGPGN